MQQYLNKFKFATLILVSFVVNLSAVVFSCISVMMQRLTMGKVPQSCENETEISRVVFAKSNGLVRWTS